MFVSQAHSFQQQARLATTLAWVAGYTNVLTILTCGTVTSHMSGITSGLGHDLAARDWPLAAFAVFLLASFFIGAAISGFCTELGRRRGWESIYVLPILIQTVMLAGFAFLLESHSSSFPQSGFILYAMTGLAAAAMGLQNATITCISSGQVRTTHVTGVVTDLGHETVQFVWWLWDKKQDVPPGSARRLLQTVYTHPPARRLVLLAAIIGTFALGSGLGTLAYLHATKMAMFPPVAFLLWIIYQDLTRPIAEIEESALLESGNNLDLPAALAVFHLRKDHDRQGRVHRMPNLLAWSERLAPAARVVILDLGEVTQLDTNAAMELRAVINLLQSQGRELIISGINSDQFQQINLSGGGDILRFDNVCSDLELAIAKGINLAAEIVRAQPQTKVKN